MKPLVWLGILSLSVTGCSNLQQIEKDPSSPYYMPPVGSNVRINEELIVPPPWARVFLQRGEVVSYGHLDRYYPSCNFELETISQRPQIIRPGEFEIIHVSRREEYMVRRVPRLYAGPISLEGRNADVAEPFMLAGGGGGGESGSGSMFMHTVRMRLESAEQPDMYMLTCRGAQDNPPDVEFVSIDEMHEAMGDKAVILLPEDR